MQQKILQPEESSQLQSTNEDKVQQAGQKYTPHQAKQRPIQRVHKPPVPTKHRPVQCQQKPTEAIVPDKGKQEEGKAEKINKDDLTTFVPDMKESVGKQGTNLPKDVKVVQKLLFSQGYYNLEVSGVCDPATIAAILDFQKKTRGCLVHDAKIDVGQSTWQALTHSYFQPDQVKRERKQFKKTRNLMVTAFDKMQGAVGFAADNDHTGLDDATEMMQISAQRVAGVDSVLIKNLHHLTAVLQKMYERHISPGVLVFGSHGSYGTPCFFIGNEYIEIANLARLKPLHNLLAPTTQIVVNACHTGGGANPEISKKFSRLLAETLGVTSYTSRSWGMGSKNIFSGRVRTSIFEYKANAANKADAKSVPYKYKLMGQWLKTSPGNEKTKVEVINSLLFKPDGSFTISKNRFPKWWKKAHHQQYKELRIIAQREIDKHKK